MEKIQELYLFTKFFLAVASSLRLAKNARFLRTLQERSSNIASRRLRVAHEIERQLKNPTLQNMAKQLRWAYAHEMLQPSK
jgi:hypothetical protein